MTRIKCCGMFRPEDIDAVNAAHPDDCGFIIDFPRSHRSLTWEEARELRYRLKGGIASVGVFAGDHTPREVVKLAAKCAFDAVQLHGGQGEDFIRGIRFYSNVTIIRAFTVRTAADLEAARTSRADYVLLDGGQGSGRAFDWELLRGFDRPYYLAGGLTPEMIPDAIERLHPFGVDISSGIETDGLKDAAKIAAAVRAARGENAR